MWGKQRNWVKNTPLVFVIIFTLTLTLVYAADFTKSEYNPLQSLEVREACTEVDKYNPQQSVSLEYHTSFWVFDNFRTNETGENQPCEFKVDIRTNGTLSHAILSTNRTGSWTNETKVSLSGGFDTPGTTVKLPAPAGTVLKYRWYANKTDGEEAVSSIQTLVVGGVLETEGVSITNVEPCGEYVFVGRKEYVFQLNYTIATNYTSYTLGLGFYDDAGDWYSWVYSNTTDRTTVVSPDDGVSGTCRSVTGSGTSKTAEFYLMFHDPVADSINTTIYSRATGGADTTGWNDTTQKFSIYNIGGATTLTKSGWADRKPSGDAFEIYAADSRTPDLFEESFEGEVQAHGSPSMTDPTIIKYYPVWDKPWMRYYDGPYSNITRTREKLDSDMTPYAYKAGKIEDRDHGLRIQTRDATNIIPMVVRKFRRSVLASDDEIVKIETWIMMYANASVSRIKVAGDYPTYLSNANTAANIYFSCNVGAPNTGRVSFDNGTGIYKMNATFSTKTWYNLTLLLDMDKQNYDVLWDEKKMNVTDIAFEDTCDTIDFYEALGSDGLGGGEPADFYIDAVKASTDWDYNYGGWAKATTVHKNLQHWHMDWDFDVEQDGLKEEGYDEGFIEMGWDLCINGKWNRDFLVGRLNITDARYPGQIIDGKFVPTGQNQNWVKFDVTWYNYGVQQELGTDEEGNSDYCDELYGFYEGHSSNTDEGAATEKDVIGWHFDMWFNLMDASSWVGGRLNNEWFGMSNKAPAWQFWASSWKPMINEVTDSTCFVELKDSLGSDVNIKEIGLVRSWVYVYRTNVSTFHYRIDNIQGMDFRVSSAEMSGIETPQFMPTLTPITNNGFLASLLGGVMKRIMQNITSTLTYGALNVWNYFVSFMDTLAAWAGNPQFFTNIISWFQNFNTWLTNMMSWSITLFTQYYSLMNKGMGKFLNTLTTGIAIWVDMLQIFFNFLDGAYTAGIDVWEDLGISQFITLGFILYPMYLIFMWEEKGFDVMMNHISVMINLGALLLMTMLGMAEFIIMLISTLIESIPVIE